MRSGSLALWSSSLQTSSAYLELGRGGGGGNFGIYEECKSSFTNGILKQGSDQKIVE